MDALLPLAESLGARLEQRGETIAVAEILDRRTMISAALLSVPGASAIFRGGGVFYTAQARSAFLESNPLPPPLERAATEPYAVLLAGHGAGAAGCELGHRQERRGGACRQPLRRSARAWLHRGDGSRGVRVITLETGSEDRVAASACVCVCVCVCVWWVVGFFFFFF